MFTHSDFKIFSYIRSLIYQELMSYVKQSFVLFLINEKFHLCNLLFIITVLMDYYYIITILRGLFWTRWQSRYKLAHRDTSQWREIYLALYKIVFIETEGYIS